MQIQTTVNTSYDPTIIMRGKNSNPRKTGGGGGRYKAGTAAKDKKKPKSKTKN
tara:strand:- start:2540 stop:2698 length:159 start_codon:yes stop_codon:yes gene_type:complete